MIKGIIILQLAFLLPVILIGQSSTVDCGLLKVGTFYFYDKYFPNGFTIIRDSLVQAEIENGKNDTSFWKVSWKEDCMYSAQFIRKSISLPKEHEFFLHSHISFIKVLSVTKDYYIFKASLDSISSKKGITDTAWFKAK